MTAYRLVAGRRVDLDVAGAFEWYEHEALDLGHAFMRQLRSAYDRITEAPLQYQEVRTGIRRALVRRFPYAVYFTIDADTIIVLAVLHVSRDPAVWQQRGLET